MAQGSGLKAHRQAGSGRQVGPPWPWTLSLQPWTMDHSFLIIALTCLLMALLCVHSAFACLALWRLGATHEAIRHTRANLGRNHFGFVTRRRGSFLQEGNRGAEYRCGVAQGEPWLNQGALDVLVIVFGRHPGCSCNILCQYLALSID